MHIPPPRLRSTFGMGGMTESGTFTGNEFMARLSTGDREELIARARTRRWPAGASLFLEGQQSSLSLIHI